MIKDNDTASASRSLGRPLAAHSEMSSAPAGFCPACRHSRTGGARKDALESEPVDERTRMAREAQVHGAGVPVEPVLKEPADRAQAEAELLGGIGFAPIAVGVVDQGDRELHRAGRLLERARCPQRELAVTTAARVVHHKGKHVIIHRGRVQPERIGLADLPAKDDRDHRPGWGWFAGLCGIESRGSLYGTAGREQDESGDQQRRGQAAHEQPPASGTAVRGPAARSLSGAADSRSAFAALAAHAPEFRAAAVVAASAPKRTRDHRLDAAVPVGDGETVAAEAIAIPGVGVALLAVLVPVVVLQSRRRLRIFRSFTLPSAPGRSDCFVPP